MRLPMPPLPSLISNTSTTVSSISPSKLAKFSELFRAWMFRANVLEREEPRVEVIEYFNKFYKTENLPRVLKDLRLPPATLDSELQFRGDVVNWAATLPSTDDDKYDVLGAMPYLAQAYIRIQRTANSRPKEHGQRRGIDDIIELAFSLRTDRRCDFRTEETYRLAESDSNPDAQSDTLVLIPSGYMVDKIRGDQFLFKDQTVIDHFFWSTIGFGGTFSLIGFAGEFKKNDEGCNKNQVIMVLTTAQLQRRALFLADCIIIGATSCRGKVQLYSAYWNAENKIEIFEHKEVFDLTKATNIVHLYLFCSRLEEHLTDTLAVELKGWKPKEELTVKEHLWRSSPRKRCRTNAGSIGGNSVDSGNAGGGDDDVPMEFDNHAGEFDNHVDEVDSRYIDLIKWRNEVVEDGKDVKTVSGEGQTQSMAWLQV